jgi:hypothetical protein
VDSHRLIQTYRKIGLDLSAICNPIESGILNVWQRLQSVRLKTFTSLSKTWTSADSIGVTKEIRS